jgi:poly(3-hydroxybutyrate) depolymerase
MKKIITLITCVAGALPLHAQRPVAALERWLERPAGNIEEQRFARARLSREEAREAAAILYRHANETFKKERGGEWHEKKLVHGRRVMPFDYRVFGEKPADGRSLYISMHGGGNTRREINDGQWRNQIRLYTPAEGVYVAPRAAVDDWNMWFQPHVDTLFAALVRLAVVEMEVNPDKVYLMGYSAGGDGVYRLAPRLADRWAAAAMMAGHPGDASPLNLRNISFTSWVGANDRAYNRHSEVPRFGRLLDSLAAADTGGYRHETRVIAGKGHWMDRQDTVAVAWMAASRRDPLPRKVAWRQDDTPRDDFYWLSVPLEEARPGARLVVEREGNTFTLLESDYSRVTIALNDAMIDFSRPVTVIAGGKVVFKKRVTRSITELHRSVEKRGDPGLLFSARVTVKI